MVEPLIGSVIYGVLNNPYVQLLGMSDSLLKLLMVSLVKA